MGFHLACINEKASLTRMSHIHVPMYQVYVGRHKNVALGKFQAHANSCFSTHPKLKMLQKGNDPIGCMLEVSNIIIYFLPSPLFFKSCT